MNQLVCVKDFEREALEKLDKNAGDYFKSGSDDEITLKRNLESYNRWLILPRMLRDVSKRNLRKTVQGKSVEFPIGFSPAGFQGLAHIEGEVLSARAAAAKGTIFVLSTYASRAIEDIRKACPNGRNWFQLFPNTSNEVTADLVRRAEKAGFEAIVVTLDAQNFGNKRLIARFGFNFPSYLKLANLDRYFKNENNDTSSAAATGGSSHSSSASSSSTDDNVNDITGHVNRTLAQNLTWDIVSFLRKQTKLPLILKGILRPEDAAMAVQHNVDGLWISNHGGRQVDTAPQPIDVLPEIARTVQGKCEVYIDSGIRKGSDVFKALALGATMAFVGRPQIWGVAVGGQEGAEQVLDIMREELDLTMALSGVADVSDITKDYVVQADMARL